jgi:hypothetical protein
MSKLKYILPLCCLLFFAGVTGFAQTPASSAPAATQATSPEVPYLRAIYDELRQLRALVQQTTIGALRARLLTEQLARQQYRVDALSEEINQLKTLIALAADDKRGEDDLQEMELRIRESADQQERARLMGDYAALKRANERERAALKKEAVEHHEKQLQLETTLRLEQGKLAELQGQLEVLDRELERMSAENKPRR